MTADDIAIAITKTPAVKINPMIKHNTGTYYVYRDSDGEWVRSEFDRVAQWQSRGVLYVLVTHVWESYKRPVNSNGDKDIVTHDIMGTHEARASYCANVAPTAHVMDDTDTRTLVLWSF
jgi:hypothetical protein